MVTSRDVDAEMAVLGCIVREPQAVKGCGVRMDDLDETRGHDAIFMAAAKVADREERPESAMVARELATMDRLSRVGETSDRGASYLHTLISRACYPENVPWYASRIRAAAVRRSLWERTRRLQKMIETVPDLDDLLDYAATENAAIGELVDVSEESMDPVITGFSTIDVFADEPVDPYSWIVPGVIEHQDRTMLIAGEGLGKSVLGRQIAILTAAGRHPFVPKVEVPRKRTLIVDLENPPNLIRRNMRPMLARAHAEGMEVGDWGWIWREPTGIDLRSPTGRRALEQVMDQARPDLVVIGPLYKMSNAGGASYEQEAAEVQDILDSYRKRYGVAWWIEHHAPKPDSSGGRVLPYGSSYWMRWPEFGLLMAPDKGDESGKAFTLGRFRGDRDERLWPDRLMRLGAIAPYPWTAEWDDGESLNDLFLLCDEIERGL